MYDLILVRYGEMTLKRKNYNTFLNTVNNNIRKKLKKFEKVTIKQSRSRLYIYLNGQDYKEVIEELNTVVGLSSYSLCKICEKNFDDIANKAVVLINHTKRDKKKKFKVETNRSDKSFGYNSIQISQEVAKRVLPKVDGLIVDVKAPELVLSIDFRDEGVFVYTDVIEGLGGFPAGTAGSGLLMTSGGIDSPVAGFLSLKKGVNIKALHFYSPPHTSEMSLQKVIELVERLAHYTPNGELDLLVVPFTEIQEEIYRHVSPPYTITIMRRLMYKIAHEIAINDGYDCIINGESIGQVASQTLESMRVVNEVTNIPILRPLITYDKTEIIKIARDIKTYDISIMPYDDCCTVFVPKHPVIKPTLKKTIYEEEKFDYTNLITKAINNITIYNLNIETKYYIFETEDESKFEI